MHVGAKDTAFVSVCLTLLRYVANGFVAVPFIYTESPYRAIACLLIETAAVAGAFSLYGVSSLSAFATHKSQVSFLSTTSLVLCLVADAGLGLLYNIPEIRLVILVQAFDPLVLYIFVRKPQFLHTVIPITLIPFLIHISCLLVFRKLLFFVAVVAVTAMLFVLAVFLDQANIKCAEVFLSAEVDPIGSAKYIPYFSALRIRAISSLRAYIALSKPRTSTSFVPTGKVSFIDVFHGKCVDREQLVSVQSRKLDTFNDSTCLDERHSHQGVVSSITKLDPRDETPNVYLPFWSEAEKAMEFIEASILQHINEDGKRASLAWRNYSGQKNKKWTSTWVPGTNSKISVSARSSTECREGFKRILSSFVEKLLPKGAIKLTDSHPCNSRKSRQFKDNLSQLCTSALSREEMSLSHRRSCKITHDFTLDRSGQSSYSLFPKIMNLRYTPHRRRRNLFLAVNLIPGPIRRCHKWFEEKITERSNKIEHTSWNSSPLMAFDSGVILTKFCSHYYEQWFNDWRDFIVYNIDSSGARANEVHLWQNGSLLLGLLTVLLNLGSCAAAHWMDLAITASHDGAILLNLIFSLYIFCSHIILGAFEFLAFFEDRYKRTLATTEYSLDADSTGKDPLAIMKRMKLCQVLAVINILAAALVLSFILWYRNIPRNVTLISVYFEILIVLPACLTRLPTRPLIYWCIAAATVGVAITITLWNRSLWTIHCIMILDILEVLVPVYFCCQRQTDIDYRRNFSIFVLPLVIAVHELGCSDILLYCLHQNHGKL